MITRLDVINAIQEDFAKDRGFSYEAFIDNDGVWREVEEFNSEHPKYLTIRPATEEELEFDKAMALVEEVFCRPKYNAPVRFNK